MNEYIIGDYERCIAKDIEPIPAALLVLAAAIREKSISFSRDDLAHELCNGLNASRIGGSIQIIAEAIEGYTG